MSANEQSLTPRSASVATPTFSWLLVVFSASVATGGEPESVRAQQSVGPGLILEDSVVLQESRDAYVGQPVEMFLGSDGSLFVIDGFSNSVARFDQSGRLIRTYGRQGRGPGEFSYIGFGGFAEEVLGVVDGRPPQQEIEFFDVESGRHLGRVATSNIVTAVTAHGEKLWVGGVNTDQWKGVGVKSLHALPGGEVALDRVPTPKPYSQSQLLLWIGGSARLHAGDADLLVGYMASPFLMRVAPDGDVLDTIPLVAGKRRGVPAEDKLLEMANSHQTGKTTYEEIFSAWSSLMNLSRSDGFVFTVHQDSELHGQQVAGKLYVSSLREDGTNQCPDTPVSTSDVGRPVAALRGASLFVLDQRIHDGEPDRLRTVVRKFTVDPTECTGQVGVRGRSGDTAPMLEGIPRSSRFPRPA